MLAMVKRPSCAAALRVKIRGKVVFQTGAEPHILPDGKGAARSGSDRWSPLGL